MFGPVLYYWLMPCRAPWLCLVQCSIIDWCRVGPPDAAADGGLPGRQSWVHRVLRHQEGRQEDDREVASAPRRYLDSINQTSFRRLCVSERGNRTKPSGIGSSRSWTYEIGFGSGSQKVVSNLWTFKYLFGFTFQFSFTVFTTWRQQN